MVVTDPKDPEDYAGDDFAVQWMPFGAGVDVNAAMEAEKTRLLALGQGVGE